MSSKMCSAGEMMSISVYEFGTNSLHMRRKCESKRRLDGNVVIITGANTGIGKETAQQLSLRGAKIYIGCRNLEKAESAINDIKNTNPNADITALKLDLSSLKSVRQFVNEFKEKETLIDILINNAGVMACPEWSTADGFEMQFGTNYLGPFLLTLSLLPLLKKSPKARVVNVSSDLYRIGKINFDNLNLRNGLYDGNKAYAQSKLAMILFTRELAKRLGNESTVNCYAVQPGIVKTELGRHSKMPETVANMLFLTPEMGAQTTLYCTLEEMLDNESGYYYNNCKRVNSLTKEALNDSDAKRLWDISCELVRLEYYLSI